MSDAAAIQRRGLRDWVRWLGGSSEGARALELDGVTAAIVPATPQRSIINSLVYDSAGQLAAAYDELVAAYADAGIAAWDVWTPDFDSEAIELLGAAGHTFDGEPAAMTLELAGFTAAAPDGLEWDHDFAIGDLGRLNEEAYGEHAEGLASAFAHAPDPDPARYWAARSDGELACVMATMEHDDDLGVYFVATPERHRGKGLAGGLMTVALLDARERGLRTSSLQASAMGMPIYERLGYRSRYRLSLYERRARRS